MPNFNVPGLGVNAPDQSSTFKDVSATTVSAFLVAENAPVVIARGGPASGNFQSSDASQTNKYTFGRDNASTGDFVWAFNGSRKGGFTSAGVFAWGTTVTTGASAGDMIIANGSSLRGIGTGGTAINLIKIDSNNVVQLGIASSGIYPSVGGRTLVNLDGGSANLNGVLSMDTTNNRLVYYSGGARYYLVGTAF